jgi:hypothetical protein
MSLEKSAMAVCDYWFSRSVVDMDWSELDRLIIKLQTEAQIPKADSTLKRAIEACRNLKLKARRSY